MTEKSITPTIKDNTITRVGSNSEIYCVILLLIEYSYSSEIWFIASSNVPAFWAMDANLY